MKNSHYDCMLARPYRKVANCCSTMLHYCWLYSTFAAKYNGFISSISQNQGSPKEHIMKL